MSEEVSTFDWDSLKKELSEKDKSTINSILEKY